jgi:hypothetical protein
MSKGMLRAIKNSYPKPIAEGYTVEIGASTAEATVQEANIDTLTRVGDGTISIEPRLTGVRAPVVVATPGEDAARGSFARLLENPTTSLYKLQNKLAGKILNLAPSLWLEADTDNATVDSAQRVSQWSDISGNNRHFTQATDGYKPLLSRADNRENYIISSEDISPADYIGVRSAKVSATEWKEDATAVQTHQLYQILPSMYVTAFSVKVKRGTGTRDARFYFVGPSNFSVAINLATGALTLGANTSATVSGPDVDGYYQIDAEWSGASAPALATCFFMRMAEAGGNETYNGDNTSSIHTTEFHIRRATSDPTYIETTTHRWHAGINGHRTLVFDGVDDLMTVTDFIGTGAETIFAVTKPYSFGGANAGRILDNGKFLYSISSTNSVRAFASDGSTLANSANSSVTLNSVAVHAVTRAADGTANHYIDGVLSGTADQASGTPEAASTDLCLGNRAARDRGFHGQIAAVIAFPKVLTAPEMNLVYNYFAAKAGTTALESVGQNGFIHSILLGWDSTRATKAHPRQKVDNRSPMPRMMGMLVDPDAEEILIGSQLATLAVDTSVSTLTFATPFEREPVAVAVPLNATAATAKITAISKTAVSVETFDIATGAVADVKFYIMVLGWDRENETSDFRKKLKTPLVKPRMEALRVLLTGTTPTVTVSTDLATITRSGVGDYTLTLNEPFKQYPVALVTGLTDLAVLSDGVSQSEVKVKVFDSLGEAVDSGFDVLILGTDSPSEYAGPMPDELPSGSGGGDGGLPALPAGD